MPNAAVTAPTGDLDEELIADVAAHLIRSGRVVPGLTVEPGGRARSWWWPLPAASDRALIAAVVPDGSSEDQRRTAEILAKTVDDTVRAQLARDQVPIVGRRPGRVTVPEAWARSLVAADPWLPQSLDPAKVRSLAEAVRVWVRSGAVVGGRARLCLRVHEPAGGTAKARRGTPWRIELLAQDQDEPSLIVRLADVWSGSAPLNGSVVEGILAALGRLARLAPEFASVLEEPAPAETTIDERGVVQLLRDRANLLEDAGIGLLLPSWWIQRPRLGLRARTRRSATSQGAVTGAGVGMDSIVSFTWEAALGDQKLTKTDLVALEEAAQAKRSLVRVRGQWVHIEPTQIAQLLGAVGTSASATGTELLRAGLGLDRLDADTELDVIGVEPVGVPWLRSLIDDALHAAVAPLPTPQGFEGRLRPYQERGTGWLTFLGGLGLGACLADDMGLGKTAQLIAAILSDPADGPTLVVCPVSVLGNWEREIARFAPKLTVLVHHGSDRHRDAKQSFTARAKGRDVVLTTYSLLARDLDHLAAVNWGRVVFDEAQQVKNPGALQTRAAQQLTARRRVALTGTPVENRLSELWSIMHLLNPGLLGSARSFRERFSEPIERDGDSEATELLRRITGPFVLRRLKSDRSIAPELPEKIETVDRCPLTREQATLYQAVVDDLLSGADEVEGIERRGLVLAGLMRLKQVCSHPAHFLGDGSPLRRRSGKLNRTEELLDEIVAGDDRVLCFTQFTAWGDLLRPYLAHRFGTEVMWLHGGVRRPARDEMVRQFETPGGPQVFLVSLKAGGTGLNLTAASHVIHLDRWWNPAVEDQATDRAHRIGQRRTVHVHKLVTTGTVEERIDAMINSKRDLAERVVGSGEDWVTELSTDELRELVALRDSEVQ